jgi:hypothetical protein
MTHAGRFEGPAAAPPEELRKLPVWGKETGPERVLALQHAIGNRRVQTLMRQPEGLRKLPAAGKETGPDGVLALQHAIGNRRVQTLMRQPAPPASPPAAPPLRDSTWMVLLTQPTSYQWQNGALWNVVNDTSTPLASVLIQLHGMTPNELDIARRDLEHGFDAYIRAIRESSTEARRLIRAGGVPQADRDAMREHIGRLADVRRRIEALLMDVHAGVARSAAPGVQAPERGWRGRPPAELTAGTHASTPAERRRLRQVMAPEREVDPTTGQELPFEESIVGVADDYRTRIRRHLIDRIADLHHGLVDDKGQAQRGSVISWDRYEDMARGAKQVVDATFGAYARRPALRRGVNLIDLWESRGREQSRMTPAQRIDEARELLRYFVRSDDGIRLIDREHHANQTRRREATILRSVINELARSHTRQLQEINRGWEGEQDPVTHRIFMQRWPNDPPGEANHLTQRHAFWETFQIFMHEYLHALTHDRYGTMASSLDEQRENTLTEGMTSLMTEIAWANVNPRDPALRQLVEGPFATLAFHPDTVPDLANRRYASYEQAVRVVATVGIRNVYAAYFLGRVDLIRPSTP